MSCFELVFITLVAAERRVVLAMQGGKGSPSMSYDVRRVELGTKLAANATLLVAGLVRNAFAFLPRLRARLESLALHFAECNVYFVENDSTDGTIAYLRRWANEAQRYKFAQAFNVKIISESFRNDPAVGTYHTRADLKARRWGHDGVKFLAKLRNRYLRDLRSSSHPNSLVLMVDVDIGVDWDNDAILEAVGHEVRWDVLCAHTWYRDGALYDAFALRGPGLQEYSPAAFEHQFAKSFFPHALCGLQHQQVATSTLLPVDSCFGGLALYSSDILYGPLRSCTYDESLDDCEHVAFHRCLRHHGAVIALHPRWRAKAEASNTTCCVDLCTHSDQFPMSFLPFEPQFSADIRSVAGEITAAITHEEQGDMQAALDGYMKAIRLATSDSRWAARAALAAAFLLARMRRADEALRLVGGSSPLTAATEDLARADPRVALLLGHLYELLDETDTATEWFAFASNIRSDVSANRLINKKNIAGVIPYSKAISEDELANARLKWALSALPVTHKSITEAHQAVERFVSGLSVLIVDSRGLHTKVASGFDTRSAETTRLVYLGQDLVPHLPELAAMFSRVHLRIMPALGYVKTDCRVRPQRFQRPRIGFISGLFGDSAVGNLARGIVAGIPLGDLEIILIVLGRLRPKATGNSAQVAEALARRADQIEELTFWDAASAGTDEELKRARGAISNLELDALVYLEVGLDVRTFVLAHSRLAPVQLVTYGHASSTGIPTLDVFVSHFAFEPVGRLPQARYTERLALLPGLPRFEATFSALNEDSRESAQAVWSRWRELLQEGVVNGQQVPQMKPRGRVYLVAQSLYKVSPFFDHALLAILASDTLAIIAIRVGHPQPAVHRRIAARLLEKTSSGQAKRIRFLPMQTASGYAWILHHASALLDTFPHGGHTTTLDALSAGIPVITLQPPTNGKGMLANGFSTGFYSEIDIAARAAGQILVGASLDECCVAKNTTDYAEKAVTLAKNTFLRTRIGLILKQWVPQALLGRTDAAVAWSNLLHQIVEQARAPSGSQQHSDNSCKKQHQLYKKYLLRPSQYVFGLFPLALRPRAVVPLRFSGGVHRAAAVAGLGQNPPLAYQLCKRSITKSSHARHGEHKECNWLVAPLGLTRNPKRSRPLFVARLKSRARLQSLHIFGPANFRTLKDKGRIVQHWCIYRESTRRRPLLGSIKILPSAGRVRLQPLRRLHGHTAIWTPESTRESSGRGESEYLPSSALQGSTSVLLQEALVPYQRVVEIVLDMEAKTSKIRNVHLSGTRELMQASVGGAEKKNAASRLVWEPRYCCASLTPHTCEQFIPQLRFEGSVLGLGVARSPHRSQGSSLHMLYAMRQRSPFEVAALSIEFCIAIGEGMPNREEHAYLSDAGDGFGGCEAKQTIINVALVEKGGGGPAFVFVVEVEQQPRNRVRKGLASAKLETLRVEFPAAVLGTLLHPVDSWLVSRPLLVKGLR